MNHLELRKPLASKMLRQFAAAWIIFFAGIAFWYGLHRGNTNLGVCFATLAVAVGVPGLICPKAARPVFKLALAVSWPLGWMISHLILALVFGAVFIPLGLVFRFIGRDALLLKTDRRRESYWLPKPQPVLKNYFTQY
jgi:Saxitoxin biosynthesis operon protein SxtJ